MEYILSSDQHKFKNNCLRYTFQKPIRFQNQYISLTSMTFYNYFEVLELDKNFMDLFGFEKKFLKKDITDQH